MSCFCYSICFSLLSKESRNSDITDAASRISGSFYLLLSRDKVSIPICFIDVPQLSNKSNLKYWHLCFEKCIRWKSIININELRRSRSIFLVFFSIKIFLDASDLIRIVFILFVWESFPLDLVYLEVSVCIWYYNGWRLLPSRLTTIITLLTSSLLHLPALVFLHFLKHLSCMPG